MKTIQFLTNKHPYTFGQIVQFKDATADALIAQGVAVLYTPPVLPPTPPPPGGGTVTSTTLIPGNPPEYNTLAKIANKLTGWDKNYDNKVDPDSQESREFPFPTALTSWPINHNYGRKPAFELFDLAGNGLDEPPRQDPTPNTTIFTWLLPQAGTATAI
jgi:hypothetical protein